MAATFFLGQLSSGDPKPTCAWRDANDRFAPNVGRRDRQRRFLKADVRGDFVEVPVASQRSPVPLPIKEGAETNFAWPIALWSWAPHEMIEASQMLGTALGGWESVVMVTTRAERRLAAIMAADVVGYSRLMETDEATTLAAIKTLRTEVIDPLLSEHKGRIVKLMGDGALVEFHSVVDAVTCAVAIQSKVAAHEVEARAERRLVFRIGINLGDVVVEGDDLFGDGVNVAARLEQLCPPGGVLISGTAYDHMKGKLSLPIDFTGEQKVKNIAEPVRTYNVRMAGVKRGWILRTRRMRQLLAMAAAALVLLALALAVAGAWWLRPVDGAIAKASIAVLPFANIGGEESTGRLADGITEDIITDLARFPEFEVVARHSVEAYKGKAVDIREVRQGAQCRLRVGGFDPASRRSGPHHRAVARRGIRNPPLVRAVGPAGRRRLRSADRDCRTRHQPARRWYGPGRRSRTQLGASKTPRKPDCLRTLSSRR